MAASASAMLANQAEVMPAEPIALASCWTALSAPLADPPSSGSMSPSAMSKSVLKHVPMPMPMPAARIGPASALVPMSVPCAPTTAHAHATPTSVRPRPTDEQQAGPWRS